MPNHCGKPPGHQRGEDVARPESTPLGARRNKGVKEARWLAKFFFLSIFKKKGREKKIYAVLDARSLRCARMGSAAWAISRGRRGGGRPCGRRLGARIHICINLGEIDSASMRRPLAVVESVPESI